MLAVKRLVLVGLFIHIINLNPAKAQTDTTKTTITQTQIISEQEEKPEPEKKRQKKTEKIAFISCLFIILTTTLLYNVRSK